MWAGVYGETDDSLPYIGQHPDFPRAWFALDYGGNGTTYSLLAAEIIRDALTGKQKRLDLTGSSGSAYFQKLGRTLVPRLRQSTQSGEEYR